MRRLKLQFPYIGQHSPTIDYSLLAIGLFALVMVSYQFTTSEKEVDYWETRVARIEQQQQQQQREAAPRRSSRQKQQNIGQEIRQEIRKASVVIDQMNLPWESFFDAIEFAAHEDVAILSLQPSIANRNMRISGEAKDMSVLLLFVEALERELVFENAHLLNYKIKLDNPHKPVAFLLTASWTQVP